jgi:hypothetical protein
MSAPPPYRPQAHAILQRLPSPQQVSQAARFIGHTPPAYQPYRPARVQACFGSGSPKPLSQEVNKGSKYRTGSSPETMADQLETESDAFHLLRDAANLETNAAYSKDLTYEAKPTSGPKGTGPAYFKEGTAFFDMKGEHPSVQLTNIVFETANAAQSRKFDTLEADFKSGAILRKSLTDYGVPSGTLSVELENEYRDGDAAARRSLVQEVYEWGSYELAKQSFTDLDRIFTTSSAKEAMLSWNSFASYDNFMTYYKASGYKHRRAVEGAIRNATKPPEVEDIALAEKRQAFLSGFGK